MNDKENKTISEVTRRNIMDAVNVANIHWSGRLDEPTFLGRLYNLEGMPSYDHRFSTAGQDIAQHTVMNSDWDRGWFFTDARFNVLHASDEEFLKFLSETVHPIVRPDAEDVAALLAIYNDNLALDGWELAEQLRLSGKPVFAARRRIVGNGPALTAAKAVAETLDAEYMTRQITRMEAAIQNDPELAIGTAKEFVETVCKEILRERGKPVVGTPDFPALTKEVLKHLKLVPDGVPEQAKGSEIIKRMLSNLGTIGQGLAELRNLYGTGHGRGGKTQPMMPRHAKLAVGAATTLATFLFETHKETQK